MEQVTWKSVLWKLFERIRYETLLNFFCSIKQKQKRNGETTLKIEVGGGGSRDITEIAKTG